MAIACLYVHDEKWIIDQLSDTVAYIIQKYIPGLQSRSWSQTPPFLVHLELEPWICYGSCSGAGSGSGSKLKNSFSNGRKYVKVCKKYAESADM